MAAREVDGRSDVYSLGVVLYECVAGAPPFQRGRAVGALPDRPRAPAVAAGPGRRRSTRSSKRSSSAASRRTPASVRQRAGEVAEALRRYRSRLRDSDRERAADRVDTSTHAAAGAGALRGAREGVRRAAAAAERRPGRRVASSWWWEASRGSARRASSTSSRRSPGRGRSGSCTAAPSSRTAPSRTRASARSSRSTSGCKDTASAPRPRLLRPRRRPPRALPDAQRDRRDPAGGLGRRRERARRRRAAPRTRPQIFELLARDPDPDRRREAARPRSSRTCTGPRSSIEALSVHRDAASGRTPTLIVGTYRTTEVDRSPPAHPRARGLPRRPPLLVAHARAASRRPSTARSSRPSSAAPSSPTASSQRLFEGTKGNLFFTKELVRSLLDAGGISRDDSGQWSLSGEAELSAEALPATIQQAVEKRIEQAARGPAGAPLGRLGHRPDVRRPATSRRSPKGRATSTTRSTAWCSEGLPRGGARVPRGQAELLERRRPRRPLRGPVAAEAALAPPALRRSSSRRATRAGSSACCPSSSTTSPRATSPTRPWSTACAWRKSSLEAFSAEEAARAAKTVLEFLDEEWEGDRALEGEARLLLARAQRMAGRHRGGAPGSRGGGPGLRGGGAARRARRRAPARRRDGLAGAAQRGGRALGREGRRRGPRQAGRHREPARSCCPSPPPSPTSVGEYAKANAYLAEAARLGAAARGAARPRSIPRGGRLVVAPRQPGDAPSTPATHRDHRGARRSCANVFETLLATDAGGQPRPRAVREVGGRSSEGRAVPPARCARTSVSPTARPLTARAT